MEPLAMRIKKREKNSQLVFGFSGNIPFQEIMFYYYARNVITCEKRMRLTTKYISQMLQYQTTWNRSIRSFPKLRPNKFC